MKKVLVINCGSSSLKYQLIDMETRDCCSQGTGGAYRNRRIPVKASAGRKRSSDPGGSHAGS